MCAWVIKRAKCIRKTECIGHLGGLMSEMYAENRVQCAFWWLKEQIYMNNRAEWARIFASVNNYRNNKLVSFFAFASSHMEIVKERHSHYLYECSNTCLKITFQPYKLNIS